MNLAAVDPCSFSCITFPGLGAYLNLKAAPRDQEPFHMLVPMRRDKEHIGKPDMEHVHRKRVIRYFRMLFFPRIEAVIQRLNGRFLLK
ncbi:hypothetical protein D3C75_1010770 [compost metagenome]